MLAEPGGHISCFISFDTLSYGEMRKKFYLVHCKRAVDSVEQGSLQDEFTIQYRICLWRGRSDNPRIRLFDHDCVTLVVCK